MLFFLLLCTCDRAKSSPETAAPPQALNAVLLTDSSRWEAGQLRELRDSLERAGYRTLVSGGPADDARTLLERLPWLRQPGVDLWLYDPQLAGPELLDSLDKRLDIRPLELVRSPSGPVVRNRRN